MKVLIVGGVVSGSSLAMRLRRLDKEAQIIILDKRENIAFANCGLPYYIGDNVKSSSNLMFQTPESFMNRYEIDARIFNQVIKINHLEKYVEVMDTQTEKVYKETYDKLVIATGSETSLPDIIGIENENIFTLKDLDDASRIKERINQEHIQNCVIIGGGYIGLGLTQALFNKNMSITLIENTDKLLKILDKDTSYEVEAYLKFSGLDVVLNTNILTIEEIDKEFHLLTDNNEILITDMVIISTGQQPNSKITDGTDIKINENGGIIVDKYFETNVKDIYAIGDVIEINNLVSNEKFFMSKTNIAQREGRMLANNLAGIKEPYKGGIGSTVIKLFHMTVARVGLNEEEVKKTDIDYDKVFITADSTSSYNPKTSAINLKIIFEKITGKILGGQLIGYDMVDKRADVLATIISMNGTAKDLSMLELCYSPIYNNAKDPLNIAGNVIENMILYDYRQFHWHDVRLLVEEEVSIQLIDVRDEYEYDNGHIKGFVNIPLNCLRDNIDTIDISKPVYVMCASGKRGYIASTILGNLGYDSYNLSGGYRLYNGLKLLGKIN